MIRILLSKKLGELRWTQTDLARVTGIRSSTINEIHHKIAERVNLEHRRAQKNALQHATGDKRIQITAYKKKSP